MLRRLMVMEMIYRDYRGGDESGDSSFIFF
jgi:hypothetical protein